jgi:hypothetical protein
MMTKDKKQKRNYQSPRIERIKLDHEISVFMNSSPEPPGDPVSMPADHFSFDPFKLPKL